MLRLWCHSLSLSLDNETGDKTIPVSVSRLQPQSRQCLVYNVLHNEWHKNIVLLYAEEIGNWMQHFMRFGHLKICWSTCKTRSVSPQEGILLLRVIVVVIFYAEWKQIPTLLRRLRTITNNWKSLRTEDKFGRSSWSQPTVITAKLVIRFLLPSRCRYFQQIFETVLGVKIIIKGKLENIQLKTKLLHTLTIRAQYID